MDRSDWKNPSGVIHGEDRQHAEDVILRKTPDVDDDVPNGMKSEREREEGMKASTEGRTETTREIFASENTLMKSNSNPTVMKMINGEEEEKKTNVMDGLFNLKENICTESEIEEDIRWEQEQPSLRELARMRIEEYRRRQSRRRKRKMSGNVLSDTGSEEMNRQDYGVRSEEEYTESEDDEKIKVMSDQKRRRVNNSEAKINCSHELRNVDNRTEVKENTSRASGKKVKVYNHSDEQNIFVAAEKYNERLKNFSKGGEWGTVRPIGYGDCRSARGLEPSSVGKSTGYPVRSLDRLQDGLSVGVKRKLEKVLEKDNEWEINEWRRSEVGEHEEEEGDNVEDDEVENDADSIMQSRAGRIRRRRGRPKGSKNRATLARERHVEGPRSGSQYSADEALKLAKAWSKQTEERIQTGEWLWTKIYETCSKVYGMHRSKASLRCKWPSLASDCQLWNSLYNRVRKELGSGNFSTAVCRKNTHVLFSTRRSRGRENPNGTSGTMKYVEAAEYLRTQPKFGLIDENGSVTINRGRTPGPPLVRMMQNTKTERNGMEFNDGYGYVDVRKRMGIAGNVRSSSEVYCQAGDGVRSSIVYDRVGRAEQSTTKRRNREQEALLYRNERQKDRNGSRDMKTLRPTAQEDEVLRPIDDSTTEVVNLVDVDEITPAGNKRSERNTSLRWGGTDEHSRSRRDYVCDGVNRPEEAMGNDEHNLNRTDTASYVMDSDREGQNCLPIRPIGVMSRALSNVPRVVRDFDARVNSDSNDGNEEGVEGSNMVCRAQGIRASKEREAERLQDRYERVQVKNVREDVRKSNAIMGEINRTQRKQMKVEMIHMALSHTDPDSDRHKKLMEKLYKLIDEEGV